MDRIFAGIVSYNPEIERLKQNIESISPQVEYVVVFENGSKNQQQVIGAFPNVLFIKSEMNIGIAAALNKLIEWGEEKGYLWMISLDDDSVCPDDYVEKMKPYLTVKKNIGIVAPVIVDRNIGIVGHNPDNMWAEVHTCITSGSFNNITIWKDVGGYDELMFIDSVDFEYCYRLRKNGYKVIQVRDVHLEHKLGNCYKRRFMFWYVTIYGHSAFRKYYIARNNIYYPLKHCLLFHFIRGNLRNLWLLIIVTFYEDDKKEKRKAIRKGWRDGMRLGK